MDRVLGTRAGMAVRLILAAALCVAVLWGCGYGIRRASINSVRIGAIENASYEARLEDRLAEALASELPKNGIRVDEDSGYAIEGTIETLSVESIAEANEVTTTYRITITGSFVLRGPGEEERKLPGSGKYITTFSSRGDLTSVIAQKDLAISRAVRDLAEEISAQILYMR